MTNTECLSVVELGVEGIGLDDVLLPLLCDESEALVVGVVLELGSGERRLHNSAVAVSPSTGCHETL